MCKAFQKDDRILKLLDELEMWPEPVLKNHKNAGHPIHKLVFIADWGFRVGDPTIDRVVEKIIAHKSKEGLYQVKLNIPQHFGGSGADQFGWTLCDAPLLIYSLVKFGVDYEKELKPGVEYLFSLARENGWPCKCSEELGKFRGPGKKDDACPYVNLLMLKLAYLLDDFRESEAAKNGVEAILNNWEKSMESHPYMFYMGTDFRKLKAPLIWYDILHVVDTLSYFSFAREDRRFQEMLRIIKEKQDAEGAYTPESIWKSWSEWDFGQKKTPSEYLTTKINEIILRSSI